MDQRRRLFQQVVQAAGFACHIFEAPARLRTATWEDEQDQIAAWIHRLPKPVGVMACNDDRGFQVLDACRRINVSVPEDVAVIGVHNDEILCHLADPKLSSLDVDTHRIGYVAAAVLERMMAGEPPPTESVFLAPRVVVARESTDVLATEDRELAEAIRFIRAHACEGLRLKNLCTITSLTQRTLTRRMKNRLGQSPKEEITRVQLEVAKGLLAETDLSVVVIAERCGFAQPKYFSQVFHDKVGTPPALYRRLAKGPR
jgi:LacI family transcriptional regulator